MPISFNVNGRTIFKEITIKNRHLSATEKGALNGRVSPVWLGVGPHKVGEVGELSEIFQWKGEVPRGLPDWEDKEKQHLGEELSDVLLYLVRLSDICGVDLGKAALRKLEINAIKYPVNLCKGSSKKHDQIINNNSGSIKDDVSHSV
ncbi:dCTP pyrophosphatase 1-like protein [Tanacetum coccineum]